MFDNLNDYNGINILNKFVEDAEKPCTIIVPKNVASLSTSEIYILTSDDNFNYFIDLTDKPEYLTNKNIIFCVCKKDDFIMPKEVYIYDL